MMDLEWGYSRELRDIIMSSAALSARPWREMICPPPCCQLIRRCSRIVARLLSLSSDVINTSLQRQSMWQAMGCARRRRVNAGFDANLCCPCAARWRRFCLSMLWFDASTTSRPACAGWRDAFNVVTRPGGLITLMAYVALWSELYAYVDSSAATIIGIYRRLWRRGGNSSATAKSRPGEIHYSF